MTSFFTKAALGTAAVSLALALSAAAPASAQSTLTNGVNGQQPDTLGGSKPHSARRPLTVRRAAAPAVVAAPVAAPVGVNPVTGVLGLGSSVVGLPFGVINGILPGANATPKGGVTNVRYVGTGAKQAEIDEGWTQPVPVDRSGPIYVVENGDPTVAPFGLIRGPIGAIGTVAQTPFRVIGAPFGGIGGNGLFPGVPGAPTF